MLRSCVKLLFNNFIEENTVRFLQCSFIYEIHIFTVLEDQNRTFFYIGVILILFFIPVSHIIPVNLIQYQTASATDDIVMNGTGTTSNSEILPLSEIPFSNYVLKNLHDDTVDTWVAWNIASGKIIHVHVTNTANIPQSMIDAMNSAITSTETVTIDDSIIGTGPKGYIVYILCWLGRRS